MNSSDQITSNDDQAPSKQSPFLQILAATIPFIVLIFLGSFLMKKLDICIGFSSEGCQSSIQKSLPGDYRLFAPDGLNPQITPDYATDGSEPTIPAVYEYTSTENYILARSGENGLYYYILQLNPLSLYGPYDKEQYLIEAESRGINNPLKMKKP